MPVSPRKEKNPMTKVSTLLSLVALVLALSSIPLRSYAQDAAEIAVRREEKAIVLRNLLASAAIASKQGDLTTAAKAYEDAWNLTEELGGNVDKERVATVEGFVATRMALAARLAD